MTAIATTPKNWAPQIRSTGPAPAKIMIVGEWPGEEDIRKGLPFSSFSGAELTRMLSEAGIQSGQCFHTLALKMRPIGNDIESFIAAKKSDITSSHILLKDKYVLQPVLDSMEILKREIELCRPNVIIALGNVSMWMLTGKWGITSWRGSELEIDITTALDYKPQVLPTYSPEMIFRKWSWRQVAVMDFRRANRMSQRKTLSSPNYQMVIRPSFSVVMKYLDDLLTLAEAGPLKLSNDIETRAGHIACIGLAWSSHEAICIPLMCVENPLGYWPADQEAAIHMKLYQLLTHKNVEGVGQNFLYDAQYYYRHLCYIPRIVRDTMIAQHSCFSNMEKSLDFLASMHCEQYRYWKKDGKEWDSSIPEDNYWWYNCEDACRTFEVDTSQQRTVDAMRLREPHDFQQKLFHPVLRTMNKGVLIDTNMRKQFANDLMKEIEERELWLNKILGRPVNIRSPKQMQDLFYAELGMAKILHRKTKTVTCDDEAMRKLATREPCLRPIINRILELRSLGVFLSTFVSAPLDVDGRMRCSYNIAGTETYRFNSRKNAFGTGANLQNIPAGGELSDGLNLPNIRKLFIPDPGKEFFDVDLSSADLRIVVWESNETEMKAMLAQGLDPYTEIAKEFYKDPTITKKDPRRQTFKAFAHGTHYLGTPEGLAERLGLNVADAKKTQAWYFSRFPRIKKWQDEKIKEGVTKRRMVENIFGYRMYFFDRIEGTVLNQAAAWIPQSTVGCLINRAYAAIDEHEPDIDILLQVHDSLSGQYPIEGRETYLRKIVEHASIELPYADPLVIPVGVKTSAKSWGDCE